MSKVIFAVIALIAISGSVCKESWQCDLAGKYSCTQQQTCCRSRVSSTGWSCFNSVRAVCCSDGISACPEKTICNLREKRCDPAPALTFLEEPVVESAPIDVNTGKEFVEGFLRGFSFFEGLAHRDECAPNDPQVIQDVLEIVDLIKGLNAKSDFRQVILQVFAKANDAYNRISVVSEGCAAYAFEIKRVLDALSSHVSSVTFLPKLAFHTLSNIGQITSKAQSSTQALNENRFADAGQGFGELSRFVLFWDFQAQLKILLEQVTAITPQDALEFAAGFNQGFTFFNNLAHQADCNLNDPQVTQDILDVVELLKNFNYSDITRLLPEIIAKATDAYQRISVISKGCEAWANELRTVAEGLAEYVTQSGYYTSLTFHTLSNIGPLVEKVKTTVSSLRGNNFRQGGNDLGDLVRFAAFWGFQRK